MPFDEGFNSHNRSQKTAETPALFYPLVQPKWKCDDVKPLRDRLTYNQWVIYLFHTSMATIKILQVTLLTMGAKFSVKSTLGIWLYQQVTSWAWKTLLRLILNTHLDWMHCCLFGIEEQCTLHQTPCWFMLWNSFWMAARHFACCLGLGWS